MFALLTCFDNLLSVLENVLFGMYFFYSIADISCADLSLLIFLVYFVFIGCISLLLAIISPLLSFSYQL